MLFTKTSENSIKLENALMLPKKQWENAQIPQIKAHIEKLAEKADASVAFIESNESDFNLFIGTIVPSGIDELGQMVRKAVLIAIGKEIVNFVEQIPEAKTKAAKYAQSIGIMDNLVAEFRQKIANSGIDCDVVIKISL